MEKEDQDWGRGGKKCRRDCNCMFHLGFSLGRQNNSPTWEPSLFPCEGSKGEREAPTGGGGARERSDSHGEMAEYNLCWYFHIIEALCGGLLYRGQKIAQSAAVTDSPLKRHWARCTLRPPPLFPVYWHYVTVHGNRLRTHEVKWTVWMPGSALRPFH